VPIDLPQNLTVVHKAVVHVYLQDYRLLSSDDWRVLLEAFDILRQAHLVRGGRSWTFEDIYRRAVEMRYATPFLEQLLATAHPLHAGIPLKARVARRIRAALIDDGWYDSQEMGSKYLLAYVYYWWDSFAKGYIFEVSVFRDLDAAGIVYTAHNVLDPTERMAICDLVIEGWQGDIKTSTCFLHASRTSALPHDFYITRLFDTRRKVWVRAVLMRPAVWQALNGDALVADVRQAVQFFPSAVQIDLVEGRFVVLDYEVWKARVRAWQRLRGE
jgi:hypothetical protein